MATPLSQGVRPGFPAQVFILVHLEAPYKYDYGSCAFPQNQTDSIEAIMGNRIECE